MAEPRALSKQERELRAAYYRAWRAKNKEKDKAFNERYWKKRAEKEAKRNGKTEF